MENVAVPQWGTIEQAGEILAIDSRTIRRMISRGEIEARRFGPRLIRVNLTALASAGRPLQYIDRSATM